MKRESVTKEITNIMEQRRAKTITVQEGQKKRIFYWFQLKCSNVISEVCVYGKGYILFLSKNLEQGLNREIAQSLYKAIGLVSTTQIKNTGERYRVHSG